MAGRWARHARVGLAIFTAATGHAAAARAGTAIAVVAPEGCPPALRERIGQQIADLADDVAWSCPSRFDPAEPFRGEAVAGDLRFWIDLTAGTEARLMLRDGRSDRFLVRRIPLPHGLDEIGREEVGQIVRSALVAVRADPQDTLTRAEARAEVARWPQSPPAAAPPTSPASAPRPVAEQHRRRPVAIEVGAFESLRSFASQLPVVGEIGVGVDAGRWGPVTGWLEGAYQPVLQYDGAPVGVALRAFAGRAGLDVSAHLAGTMRGRVGAGVGVTRTSFTPQTDGAAATAAPPGSFSYLTGRALVGWDAPLGARAAFRWIGFVDVVGADVHYDVRDPDGVTRRILVPHRFQPGVTMQLSCRF